MQSPASSGHSVDQILALQKQWLRKEMDSLMESLFAQLKKKFDDLAETSSIFDPAFNLPDFSINSDFSLLSPSDAGSSVLGPDANVLPPIINKHPNCGAVKQEILTEAFQFGEALHNSTQSNQLLPLAPVLAVSKLENSDSLLHIPLSTTINQVDALDFIDFSPKFESSSDCEYKDALSECLFKKEEPNQTDEDDFKDNIENYHFDFLDEHDSPTKKMRMEVESCTEEVANLMTDSYKSEDGEQPTILLTKGLKCHLDTCNLILGTKAELNQHMTDAHGILPNRCILLGCGHSFHTHDQLANHVNSEHSLSAEWKCSKCDKFYAKESQLFFHISYSHQSGIFMCAVKDCSYRGSLRRDVYRHFEQMHQRFSCNWKGCGKSFKQNHHLKAHERIHKGIKPFRCKWDECGYASEDRANVIRHIRGKHLNLPQTLKEQMARHIENTQDPKEYLEVASELLT